MARDGGKDSGMSTASATWCLAHMDIYGDMRRLPKTRELGNRTARVASAVELTMRCQVAVSEPA